LATEVVPENLKGIIEDPTADRHSN
jgi:hypothetical protein